MPPSGLLCLADSTSFWANLWGAGQCKEAERNGESCADYKKESKQLADHLKWFILDGKRYTKDQLIRDFLQVAYQKHMAHEDIPVDYGNGYLPLWQGIEKKVDRWEQIQEWYPYQPAWLNELEYMSLKLGVDFDALNRWSGKEITIGFGLPPVVTTDERRDAKTGEPADYLWEQKIDSNLNAKIEKIISARKRKVEGATGLSLRILFPEEETKDNFARIRIITSGDVFLDSRFKTNRLMRHPRHPERIPDVLYRLERGFSIQATFTPFSPTQLDGFIFPNKKNNLHFVVCRIWPGLKGEMLPAFVSECLVRAMGLPEISSLNEKALVGTWNKGSIPDMNGYDGDASSIPDDISEYDVAMMSLLYCKDLSAGMGRYQALYMLRSTNNCFSLIRRYEP